MTNARDKANIPVLNFSSKGIDDNASSTAITVDSSNDVGIGTNSPGSYRLNVTDTANTNIRVTESTNNILLDLRANTTGGLLRTTSNHPFVFGINQNEIMRLNSTGLGIGTSSIDDTLHVKGNVFIEDSSPEITFETTGSSKSNWQIAVQENVDQALEISVGSADADASNDSFTPVAVFKNNGKVAINTTDPKEKLDTRGAAVFSGDHATSANAYGTAHGVMVSSVSGVGKITAISNGANDVDLELRALDGGNALANQLYLKGSSGRVGVNTNNPSRTFTVSGQLMTTQSASGTVGTPNLEINGGGYSGFHFLDTAAYFIGQNSQNRNLRIFSGNNAGVGVQLTPQGTSFGSYSDERLKKDITDLTNGLDKISEMRPVNFKYKTDADDYRNRIGIIAQSLIGQVDEALDLTKKDADDETKYYNVRYQDLIPVLVKGMQEQQTQIEELKAEVTALKNQP